ncbi:MAG: SdpI family protein [Sphingomonadaceae bacterium]
MTRKHMAVATALLVALMLGAGLIVGAALPEDAQLPVHWNLHGEADGFDDKWTALLAPAGLTALMGLLFYFLPALEPRRKGLERSQGLYLSGWAAVLLVCAVIEVAVVAAALGRQAPMDRLMIGALGLMFILIGNQLGKSRSMYMVGIRTPWTLASEEVWIKTHRLGGRLMVLAGFIYLAAALAALPSSWRAALLIAAIAAIVVVPVVYSFLLWKREQESDQASG